MDNNELDAKALFLIKTRDWDNLLLLALPIARVVAHKIRKVNELAECEDIVQDAVPRLMRSLRLWRPGRGRSYGGWVDMIVRRSSAGHRRLGPLGISTSQWRAAEGDRPNLLRRAMTARDRQTIISSVHMAPVVESPALSDVPSPCDEAIRAETEEACSEALDQACRTLSVLERAALHEAMAGKIASSRAHENALNRAVAKIRCYFESLDLPVRTVLLKERLFDMCRG